jgi:hypothetical protein
MTYGEGQRTLDGDVIAKGNCRAFNVHQTYGSVAATQRVGAATIPWDRPDPPVGDRSDTFALRSCPILRKLAAGHLTFRTVGR